MSLWSDAYDEVVAWTNRPELVLETTLALRNSLRAAHRMGKFPKDLVAVPNSVPSPLASAVPDNWNGIQTIDLADVSTRVRQLKSLSYPVTGNDGGYVYQPPSLREVDADDLFDVDGFWRYDVFWLIGTTIYIRARVPQDSYSIVYYTQPLVDEAADSWILADYRDVPVLLAAATVLGTIGEQEIKSRVDQLLSISVTGLVSDNTEAVGR